MIKQNEDYDEELEGYTRTTVRIPTVYDQEEEVLALTWAVMDGVATAEEKERLGRLVQAAYEHRSSYLRAMALSRDLSKLFSYDDEIIGNDWRTPSSQRAS